jgi:hypothetical protein
MHWTVLLCEQCRWFAALMDGFTGAVEVPKARPHKIANLDFHD